MYNPPYSHKKQNGVITAKSVIVRAPDPGAVSISSLEKCQTQVSIMDETGAEVEIEHRDLFAAHGRDRETVGGVTCCVPGCYNNTYEDAKKRKFHKFPQDASQCRLSCRQYLELILWSCFSCGKKKQ